MGQAQSERRLIENEVIFKQYNVGAIGRLEELHDIAASHGQSDSIPDPNKYTMHFYCECADMQCRIKIKLKPGEYKDLHASSRHFIIKPGHEVTKIEKVIKIKKDYAVVEKFIKPPPYSVKIRNIPTVNS